MMYEKMPHVGDDNGGTGVQVQRQRTPLDLRAPWPWYGGKRRWAEDVITRLGDVTVYVEPFAGSLAVLLASPVHDREIVCDTDGMICNAWRAIQNAPDEVAFYADYPTIHQDLTARRHWLADWRDGNAEALSVDPEFYDARAAGWWIWCLSNWIGPSGDMLKRGPKYGKVWDVRPQVEGGSGQGVQAQRKDLANDKRPYVHDHGSHGRGVSAQRKGLRDQRPIVEHNGGGRGVTAQRKDLQGAIGDGSRLSDWMYALAARLSGVVVLNRDWTSAVTPTLLQHTATAPKPPVGIFLDPPYLLDSRGDLYEGDTEENNPARAAYEWALEHGDVYRIAYACHEGDFPVPEGWDVVTRSFSGIKVEERRGRQDLVMFSPACVVAEESSPQLGLF